MSRRRVEVAALVTGAPSADGRLLVTTAGGLGFVINKPPRGWEDSSADAHFFSNARRPTKGTLFTGGIGEHAAAIRERICAGLEFLGIRIDAARNQANAPLISEDDSRVKVRVIKTNEDLMIARHTINIAARA